MRFLVTAAIVATALATSAQAAVVADFELNGSTANAVADGVSLTNNGGTLGATGITFGLNQGPTVSGLGSLASYTIDVGFTLDAVNGPRNNGYVKLIDFSGLTSDAGYYSYLSHLNAYPLSNSPNPVFSAGVPVRLTISRDNTGLITAYIDGNQIYTQSDPTDASHTTITALNPLRFFTDDVVTASGEASSGFVDYIRIADVAVTPGDITPVPPTTVPEPATWAMMLAGVGAAGAVRRRREAVSRG